MRLLTAVVFTGVLLLSICPALAVVWDGGPGVWDTTNAHWDGGGTWAQGGDAMFSAPAGIVTLGEDITAGAITVDAMTYTIDLGGKNLTANSVAVTANVTGPGTLIANSSLTQSTFTIGNDINSGIQDTSYIKMSGNMAVVVKDTAWTPQTSNPFTGDLTIQGNGVRPRS